MGRAMNPDAILCAALAFCGAVALGLLPVLVIGLAWNGGGL